MTLQLPYDGIGGPLPTDPAEQVKELQRRLEGIEGNFLELASRADQPIVNRKKGITTEETVTSTSFTTLTTADQVSNVWLPPDGLLFVLYHASWKSSVAGAGSAAIFLNANQLQVGRQGVAPVAQSADTAGTNYHILGSFHEGLTAFSALGGFAGPSTYTSDVTTGQAAGGVLRNWYSNNGGSELQSVEGGGGPAFIFAAPGTYTVSVRFKSTSGSVSVKNRRLWCWTMNF